MPESSAREFVEGVEILQFLQDDPAYLYSLHAKNSKGPICALFFNEIASFFPEWVRIKGLLHEGKIWGFYVHEAADIVAEFFTSDDPVVFNFIRSSADRICHACGECKTLFEYGPFSHVCLECETKKRVRLAEASGSTRRANEARGGEWHTEGEWNSLLDSCGGKCLRCGTPENITRDHVVPVSMGGANSIANMQPLCGSCNSWKQTRTIDFRANPRPNSSELPGSVAVSCEHPEGNERPSRDSSGSARVS